MAVGRGGGEWLIPQAGGKKGEEEAREGGSKQTEDSRTGTRSKVSWEFPSGASTHDRKREGRQQALELASVFPRRLQHRAFPICPPSTLNPAHALVSRAPQAALSSFADAMKNKTVFPLMTPPPPNCYQAQMRIDHHIPVGTPTPGVLKVWPMDKHSWPHLGTFTFTFHFHALEKAMATHSSVLAWRIPGMGEPGGLPSMGSHRVGHN